MTGWFHPNHVSTVDAIKHGFESYVAGAKRKRTLVKQQDESVDSESDDNDGQTPPMTKRKMIVVPSSNLPITSHDAEESSSEDSEVVPKLPVKVKKPLHIFTTKNTSHAALHGNGPEESSSEDSEVVPKLPVKVKKPLTVKELADRNGRNHLRRLLGAYESESSEDSMPLPVLGTLRGTTDEQKQSRFPWLKEELGK